MPFIYPEGLPYINDEEERRAIGPMMVSDFGPQQSRLFDHLLRPPHEEERKFFSNNPHIAGRPSFEDNNIVLNPYSSLSDIEKQSVIMNEGARLFMRQNDYLPAFQ